MSVDNQEQRFAVDLGRALLAAQPGGVMVCSSTGKCQWANEAAARYLGVPRESLLGLQLPEIDALKGSGLLSRADETMRTGQPCRLDADLGLGDTGGPSLIFQLSRVELLGQSTLLIFISDVGSRGGEQAAARASVERYRQLVDSTSDLIYGYDSALTLTGINRAAAQSLGLLPAEAVGKPLWDLGVPAATYDLWMRMTEEALGSRGVVREVVEAAMPDGQTHAYESLLGPVLDDEDCVVGFRGVSRDITALKRVETELRESEERFRGIFEQGSVGIALLDPGQSFVRANAAFCSMLGYAEDELLGMKMADITAAEDVESSLEGSRALYSGERSVLTMEKRYRRKDGALMWGDLSVSLVRGDDGEPVGSLAVVQDITSRKEAEESLRLAVFSVNHAGLGVFWCDPGGRFLSVNDYLCERLGYTRDELLGMTVADVDPNAPRPWHNHWIELRERRSLTFESLMRTQNGEEFPIDATGNYVEFGGKEYNFGLVVDTSERKRLEESLRRTQFIVDHSQDLVHWLSPEGQFLYVNDASCRRLGYSREELLGMTVADIDPLADRTWSSRFQEIKERGCSIFESLHRTKDGETLPVEVTADYVCYGGREYSCASARDITERKRAERELKMASHAIEHAGLGALRLDRQGRVRDVNGYLCRLLGYSREELLRLTAFDVVAGLGEGAWTRRWGELKALGPATFERNLRAKNGGTFPVEISSIIVELEGVEYDHAFIRDMSGQKAAEKAVRESEDRYQTLVNLSPDAMIVNVGGKYAFANPAAATLFGASSPRELLGQDVMERIHPDDRRRVAERITLVLSGAVTPSTEIKIVRLDGSPVEVEVTAARIEFDGSPAGQVIFRDITDRIRVGEERLELERRLQQSQRLESLGVLAGGIAHDFNNILMSVLGNAELALTALPAASSVRGNLHEITASSRRAADLCRQMLAYSGRGQLVAEAIDLSTLIADMLGFLRSTVSKKALLDLNLGENLPLMCGDASQISQVIMNLVLNASEAMGECGGVITISTSVNRCLGEDLEGTWGDESLSPGLYLTLEISDTGCGMDMSTINRVFEPFFTTKFCGRGLGLSAVLGIVRGHKGSLRLSSELDKGTTFKILFPVSETAAKSTGTNKGAKRRWRGEGTVLLADDEEPIRTLGVAMLHSLGFTVLTAADGREALSVYAEHRDEIALVLLDLTMPHMDGEEALRELRALNPGVRVILSSGYAQADVIARFAGEDLVGFVHKPYSLAELEEQLRTALEGGRPDSVNVGT